MRCFIIDDDKFSNDSIIGFIKKTPFLTLVGISSEPIKAKEAILNGDILINILFIGIEMREANGIDMAYELKNYTDIVFISHHRHYGSEAFSLSALDYMLKPISYDRFKQSIKRIVQNNFTKHIFVKSGKKGKFVKIECNEILFVESQLNYLIFNFENRASISSAMTMLELEEKLRDNPLIIRTHRSFFINKTKIIVVKNKNALLQTNVTIPVSNSFYKNIIGIL